MKKLYTIFINFNSGEQLLEGVKVVLKSKSVTGIIVVDNASVDDSLILLNSMNSQSRVTIIKNKSNLGFNKALNIGIRKALSMKADMVMPLDFDLDFSSDFITKLSKVDADIVAPVLKSKMDGKWFYDYGGRINWHKGSGSHLIKYSPLKNIGELTTSIDRTKPNWIDFVSGGCTIIKKEVIEKIGYFDEDYFVYWGDADFTIKARDSGFKVVMDGNTIVHHKLEISRQTKNINKLKISFFDNLTFIKKRVKWYYKPIAYLNIFFFSLKISLNLFK